MNTRFALVAMGILLAACGGGAAPTPATAPTLPPMVEPAQTTPLAPPAAATAASGGATPNSRVAPTALPSQGGTAPEATKPPLAKATTAPTQAAPASNDGSVLGELNQNLSSLKSYRMNWTMQWDGKDKDGKAVQGSFALFQEYIAATKDQHMRWDSAKDGKSEERFEMFNIGQDFYMYSPEKADGEKCVAGSGAGMEGSVVEPWDFFGNMSNAKLIKKGETVNGIVTDHYQVDEKTAGLSGVTSGSGDVWVAQDGKFTVKYSGKFSGKGALFAAEMTDGTISWNYDLTDANKVSAITPPADCKKPGTTLPIPDDATEKSSIIGMTMFKTKMDLPAVMAFYKTKLAALGYKVSSENTLGGVGTLTMTKDKLSATIMVSDDNGTRQVIIQEGP